MRIRQERRYVINLIQILVLYIFLGVAAVYDARSHRIPNFLILTGYGSSFVIGLIVHEMGFLWLFFLRMIIPYFLIPLYILGQMGAGDIKCISVMSTVAGLTRTARIMVLGEIFLGLYIGLRYLPKNQRKKDCMKGGIAVAPALLIATIMLEITGKL